MGSTKQPMSFRLPRGASQIFPAEEYELGEGGHHRLRKFLVPWTSFFSDAAVIPDQRWPVTTGGVAPC